MKEHDNMPSGETSLSRRELLRAGAAGAAGLALGGFAGGAEAQYVDETGPYGAFRMGIQSYSLRGLPFEGALETTGKFFLRYWEAFPAHIPQTDSPQKIQEMLGKLKAANVRLWAWGVVGFDGNEANARKVFEFAKAMGIRVISADPTKEAMPVLHKLVQQYRIKIAIHNHGPGSRYDKTASVVNAYKDFHPNIGACLDTGHCLRSGEDPVEAVKTHGKRLHGLHLKDVKGKTVFTEIGKGDLRTPELFALLRKMRFRDLIALEYEEHESNPAPYIDLCLTATRDAIEKAKYQR